MLAHELGHLARDHGRTSNWVYLQKLRWGRLQTALEARQSRGGFPFKPFLNWFAPYFNAFSFPMARANEYEADAAAVRLTSPQAAAMALTTVEAVSRFLAERHWPRMLSLQSCQRASRAASRAAALARSTTAKRFVAPGRQCNDTRCHAIRDDIGTVGVVMGKCRSSETNAQAIAFHAHRVGLLGKQWIDRPRFFEGRAQAHHPSVDRRVDTLAELDRPRAVAEWQEARRKALVAAWHGTRQPASLRDSQAITYRPGNRSRFRRNHRPRR
nr:M48 family metalloprotease [Accumulibacter sp.]